MSLITRVSNGGPLTINQMDSNLLYLEQLALSGTSSSGTSSTTVALVDILTSTPLATFDGGVNTIELMGGDINERYVEWVLENPTGDSSLGMFYPDFIELQSSNSASRGDIGIFQGSITLSQSDLNIDKTTMLYFHVPTHSTRIKIPAYNQTINSDGAAKTLALSVNGTFADSTGNITLAIGGGTASTPDLQAVLNVGAYASKDFFRVDGPNGAIAIDSTNGITLTSFSNKNIAIYGVNSANITATTTGINIQGGGGSVTINGNTGGVFINGQGGLNQGTVIDGRLVLKTSAIVPASSADSGEVGEFRLAANYIYWYTSGGWLRAIGSTF